VKNYLFELIESEALRAEWPEPNGEELPSKIKNPRGTLWVWGFLIAKKFSSVATIVATTAKFLFILAYTISHDRRNLCMLVFRFL